MLCSRTADYWEYFLSFHKFANAIDANVDMTEAAAVDWIFRRSNGSSFVLINDRGSRLTASSFKFVCAVSRFDRAVMRDEDS